MWKRSDVDEKKIYYLSLDQLPNGRRIFALHELDVSDVGHEAVFLTGPVPNDLLVRRDFQAISETVRTTTGERFFVDAHGIWLAEAEVEALKKGEWDQVPWVNGIAPNFAPR